MNLISFYILFAVIAVNACRRNIGQQQQVRLTVLDPVGLKACIPYEPGMQMFSFHANVNIMIEENQLGTYHGGVYSSLTKLWCVQNGIARIKIGDRVNYWGTVKVNDTQRTYCGSKLIEGADILVDQNVVPEIRSTTPHPYLLESNPFDSPVSNSPLTRQVFHSALHETTTMASDRRPSNKSHERQSGPIRYKIRGRQPIYSMYLNTTNLPNNTNVNKLVPIYPIQNVIHFGVVPSGYTPNIPEKENTPPIEFTSSRFKEDECGCEDAVNQVKTLDERLVELKKENQDLTNELNSVQEKLKMYDVVYQMAYDLYSTKKPEKTNTLLLLGQVPKSNDRNRLTNFLSNFITDKLGVTNYHLKDTPQARDNILKFDLVEYQEKFKIMINAKAKLKDSNFTIEDIDNSSLYIF